MRVRTRLLLLGAVGPVVAMVCVAAIAGIALDRRLRDDMDRHLLSQAAVESVGLFDGKTTEPHLHAHVSPLAADLQEILPDGALYKRDGTRIVVTREGALVPATLVWNRPLREVTIRDGQHGALPMRELLAAVRAPWGTQYTLYLAVPTRPLQATMRGYWWAAAGAVGGVGVALVLVQLTLAGGLVRRLSNLRAYLPRLRDGQAEPPPHADASRDELADLRDGLYQAARQLESQRAAEQRWLATAAHDLRTPLGVMRTTVDLALRRQRSEESLRHSLEAVGEQVDRLRALAESLLVARGGPQPHETVDLAELVQSAVRGIEPQAQAAGLRLALQVTPGQVRGDAVALRRLLDNLLHNAAHHAPSGTSLDVSLERVGSMIRLGVRDRGPGIQPSRRQEVFQPFVRGELSTGAGLGLAIVRQIAAEHGGEAWIADAEGEGTLVHVDLPEHPPP